MSCLHCLIVLLVLLIFKSYTIKSLSVIDFLKDIQYLHDFATILIAHKRDTTIAKAFTTSVSGNDAYDTMLSNESSLEDSVRPDVQSEFFLQHLMSELKTPVLQMNELATFSLRKYFHNSLMCIVYMNGDTFDEHSSLLNKLVVNLRHMLQSKMLFLLKGAIANSEEILLKLFKFCWTNKIINVVVLFENYKKSATFYSYNPFPQIAIEMRNLSSYRDDIIYPYRVGNLKGYKLPFIMGGSDPRLIVFQKSNGARYFGGFVAHFIEAFAHKYNCTLYEPLPAKIGAFAPAQELIAAVRNNTVDISIALTFPLIPMDGYTYPYEQFDWCLMLPMEPDIPDYRYYVIVFENNALILTLSTMFIISMILSRALSQHGYRADFLDLIVHDNCLRGILGQSFLEVANAPMIVRWIYVQICFLGILLTTSYNAYFATYVTSAPKEAPFHSYDDILQSGMKIYAWLPEYQEIMQRTPEARRYSAMFYIEKDYRRYLKTRDSFNTKYGYIVPTIKWTIINEQQKMFTKPIFRHRDDLCFFFNLPLVFPVHDNSIFASTLYQLMLETAQSGLTDYWSKFGFLELVAAGKLSFADLSKQPQFEPMKIEDLQYIWIGMAAMSAIGSLVFLAELSNFHRAMLKRHLKVLYRRVVCRRL